MSDNFLSLREIALQISELVYQLEQEPSQLDKDMLINILKEHNKSLKQIIG